MANKTVKDVIVAIQQEVATVSGIKAAPAYPPDKMAAFPFAVAYPQNGRIDAEFGSGTKGLHNIVVEVHLARKMLNVTVESAIDYVDSIPDEMWGSIFDNTFLSTFSTFQSISYEFTGMSWGGVETLGVRFMIEGVKVHKNL
ncbi:MAG: hypothetical protein GWN76_24425 [candidate division Zixibacteria bacterium]|nr:hypothetical protein [candidate division Zixibacteria bacterium]NIS48983.1 hypothetical protein [candidate division Zixibacteria bacterium]NIU17066.1 hypothetical protein [candidate division Zixibacteria bacterium]NIW97067.1 hypothetical protein [Phycisphaerae bacterium]